MDMLSVTQYQVLNLYSEYLSSELFCCLFHKDEFLKIVESESFLNELH